MTSLILVLMSTIPAADEAGPALRPEAVESLFIEPDRPATIRWRADRDLPADSIAYTIRDFHDREVGTGAAERPDPRTVAVQVTLAQGYYELELSGVPTRFGWWLCRRPPNRPTRSSASTAPCPGWCGTPTCDRGWSASCIAAGSPCRASG